MQQTDVIIISSVVGGFTLFAVVAATCFVITRRRRRREVYRNLSRDQEQPVRIFAVQQGRVITVTESQRNVSIRGLRWPVSMYSSGTIRSASKARSPSRKSVASRKQKKHVVNPMQEKRGREAENMDSIRQTSDDLGYAFPSAPENARTRDRGEKQGYSQPPKQLPVIYDSVISDSLMKAYEGVPYPKGRRKHRRITSTAPSSLRLSVGDRSRPSTYHPISATGHLLEPTTPGSQMSSAVDSLSWKETMMPSTSWSQAPESFLTKSHYPLPAPSTGRSSAESSFNEQKHLPALPARNQTRTPPVPQISQAILKAAKKPKLDLNILQAASVSAIPPSAFNSYRSSLSNGESMGSANLAKAEEVSVKESDGPSISVQRVTSDVVSPLSTRSIKTPRSSNRNSKNPSMSWISPVSPESPPSSALASKPRYVPTHLNLTIKQQEAPPRLNLTIKQQEAPTPDPSIPARPPRLPEIIDEHDPYKDKPLPSPRSHSPSFVVSPISSHFNLDQMEPPFLEPVKPPQRQESPAPYCGHAPASAAELYNLEAASGDFLPPAIWRLG
ncbi:hypothetical protein MMC30_003875 [Trapelia coarctata]|nr:hypothetical protein [Trapelia coarctata]